MPHQRKIKLNMHLTERNAIQVTESVAKRAKKNVHHYHQYPARHLATIVSAGSFIVKLIEPDNNTY